MIKSFTNSAVFFESGFSSRASEKLKLFAFLPPAHPLFESEILSE